MNPILAEPALIKIKRRFLPYEHALASLLGLASPLPAESVGLMSARGRVLAEPVVAPRSRPTHDLSAMDGYAVRAADLALMRTGLPIVASLYPGAGTDISLGPGEAARITTGARLPQGADRVVMTEEVVADGDQVTLIGEVGWRDHVRRQGSDFGRGDILAPSGAVLGPAALMAAAAAEATYVRVHRRPTVMLIVTGDEIADADTAGFDPYKIPDSLSAALAAQVEEWGGQVVERIACADRREDLARLLEEARERSDIVVITGGASGSERDLARPAAIQAGASVLFAGVAMKPGKPIWAAERHGQLIIGLPGNPIAGLVTGRLFLAPLLASLDGRGAASALAWQMGQVQEAVAVGGAREQFLLARSRPGGRVSVHQRAESSIRADLVELDVLARIAVDDAARQPGAEIAYLKL
jgi:molybdopterin molybdotransferase